MLATYLRRLAALGVAPKGFAAYRYQMRSILQLASRLAGRAIMSATLFQQAALFGCALVDDRGIVTERQLSRWTLAQRRSAIRSFATLMQPELQSLLGQNPHAVIDNALRSVAQRAGAGYRLSGGKPRKRGGYAPSRKEVAAVIAAAAMCPGFTGLRNSVFFRILVETGTRVNALRELDGTDCVVMPSGRLRLFVHAKGKAETREVELSQELSDALRRYVQAYNRHAAVNGWRVRIHLGRAGPIWRNSARGCWPYPAISATLRAACERAGRHEFTSHALRRAFATDAATIMPRHVVALAGGWQGLERLDDHYIQTRDVQIWEKLQRADMSVDRTTEEQGGTDGTTITLPNFILFSTEIVPA